MYVIYSYNMKDYWDPHHSLYVGKHLGFGPGFLIRQADQVQNCEAAPEFSTLPDWHLGGELDFERDNLE